MGRVLPNVARRGKSPKVIFGRRPSQTTPLQAAQIDNKFTCLHYSSDLIRKYITQSLCLNSNSMLILFKCNSEVGTVSDF